MKTYLLIGGTSDGQRVGVSDATHCIKMAQRVVAPKFADADYSVCDTFTEQVYERHQLQDGDGVRHDVFAPNPEKVIAALIERYPRPESLEIGIAQAEQILDALTSDPFDPTHRLMAARLLNELIMKYRKNQKHT